MREDPNLRWLLDDLVERLVGLRQVAVMSTDGLLIARSSGISAEDAEHLSAVACAFHSLARGTAGRFAGGAVHQTVVEMAELYLCVSAAGPNACLAVVTDVQADLGSVAYEVGILVTRVGRLLSTGAREQAVTAEAPPP